MTESRPAPKPQVTAAQVKKARMLVSMLGADFAKTSPHPFFKDLARTAVQPMPERQASPDMSAALARLVKNLADPRVVQKLKSKAPPTPEPAFEPLDLELVQQHPVLIAKQLVPLAKAERLAFLRQLQGRTARQVAAYLTELEAEPKE